ncbi:MAG: hypothetical protein IJS14_03850, partial [Lentisphaeria bacterium]|nr:hypothetical protein [Lentisphaeria bacterium]
KGNAPSVIANAGGGILNGVTANGVAYVSGLDYAGAITLTKDQQAIDVTVRGFETVTSRDAEGNPVAWNVTIASLNVSSGGIVKGATVGEEGAIYVSQGADVSGLTASGGRLIFENEDPNDYWTYLPGSQAVAGITVKDGGILQVNSKFGLTATNMQIGESAGLDLYIVKDASDEYAKTELNGTWQTTWGGGTFHTDNGVLTGFGGQFGYEYRDPIYSSAYTSARLGMIFLSGGVLSGGDLRGYGYVTARNGGKIINTHIRGITANIGASGYASGLTATTESTGSAYDTNIYVYGSGAVADKTVLSGGFLAVENGATVNGVTMMAPEGYNGPFGNQTEVGPAEMEITADGRANNVVASAGVVTLYNGSYKDANTSAATLSNADIHSAATLIVNDDGVVLDGTLNLGGLVTTTAERTEWVEVEVTDPDAGNVYSDWQPVKKNNAVANASTLTVNFDLTEHDGTEEDAMIDNLANLQGAQLGTITVSADQAGGQYVLAQGAEGFNGSLTINSAGHNLGTISVGGFWQVSPELTYSLSNSTDAGLVFSVLSTDAAVTDIVATSDGKELLKGKWSKYAITIKTEVNQYAQSIWYRIKQAVLNRRGPADDGWTLLDNDTGVTISQYCTVEFMALNAKGEQSRIVSYTVNYDDTPAVISDLRSEAGDVELQEGEYSIASVQVTDNLDEAPTLELRTGEDTWTEVERREDGRYEFTVTGNGEYTLRATDHADNITVQTVTVDYYAEPEIHYYPAHFTGAGTALADVAVYKVEEDGLVEALTDTGAELYGKTVIGAAPAPWSLVGIGDFNADGVSDILWRNMEVGEVGTWLGDGNFGVTWQSMAGAAIGEWEIAGIGDFNGDATDDVLWYNTQSGLMLNWQVQNGQYAADAVIAGASVDEWRFAGTGDFNGDGTDDILWHNQISGTAGYWALQGGTYDSWQNLAGADPTEWTMIGIGDFDANGYDDVLWLNNDTGLVGCWANSSSGEVEWNTLAGAGDLGGWQYEGVGDFNSDGRSDVLWVHRSGSMGAWITDQETITVASWKPIA